MGPELQGSPNEAPSLQLRGTLTWTPANRVVTPHKLPGENQGSRTRSLLTGRQMDTQGAEELILPPQQQELLSAARQWSSMAKGQGPGTPALMTGRAHLAPQVSAPCP